MIEEALAGQVVIDTDDVRRTWLVQEFRQLGAVDSRLDHEVPEAVILVDAAGEEIEREPAAMVVELRLVLNWSSAVSLSQIFGLNEPRSRIDSSDRVHRRPNPRTLIQKGTH